MDTPTVWRGSTMRDRAFDRRERLVEAGYELVGTEGAAAVTVRAVCRGAGLSRNYFYESFSSREELLRAVGDRVYDEMRAFVESAPQSGTASDRLRAVFEAGATYLEEDARRVRIILREFVSDETLREHANQMVPLFFAAVSGSFAESINRLPIDATRPATFAIGAVQIYGAVSATYLGWLEGRLAVTRDEVAAECAELVLSVLDVRRRHSS
ncbi:TetR family transcriptional regulator [Mycobacteroides stephanolepidis]|uniref:TetR family transcriptional regulator n=1 Tax=[Mycobacterium] stephanolepidis TaxID=1520670 RepID=A0A1Z4ETC0_9MYCO|nr:TetR/AcrR family transcriptional regulator [[Mycobacterium] stephanolepidis]BAX96208.1 TetR family transcriptional regulator [[Mycobacterium] stephanolepidis]